MLKYLGVIEGYLVSWGYDTTISIPYCLILISRVFWFGNGIEFHVFNSSSNIPAILILPAYILNYTSSGGNIPIRLFSRGTVIKVSS